MYKKIIGILICMLFIGIIILPSFESYKTNDNKIENASNDSYLFGELEETDDSGISLSNKGIEFTSSNDNLVNMWVIYPNGGEILHGTIKIRWEREVILGIYHEYYKIYCVGQSKTYNITTHTEYNVREFSWNTKNVPNGSYKIKVEMWGTGDIHNPEPSYFYGQDYSNDWFTIDNKIKIVNKVNYLENLLYRFPIFEKILNQIISIN